MTSNAFFLLVGCLSMGMPRPSSSMLMEDPSACSVTQIFEGWPLIASRTKLYRIFQNFPDKVVKPGGSDSPDIHAGPLANRLQSFENGDVFSCVVSRRHV